MAKNDTTDLTKIRNTCYNGITNFNVGLEHKKITSFEELNGYAEELQDKFNNIYPIIACLRILETHGDRELETNGKINEDVVKNRLATNNKNRKNQNETLKEKKMRLSNAKHYRSAYNVLLGSSSNSKKGEAFEEKNQVKLGSLSSWDSFSDNFQKFLKSQGNRGVLPGIYSDLEELKNYDANKDEGKQEYLNILRALTENLGKFIKTFQKYLGGIRIGPVAKKRQEFAKKIKKLSIAAVRVANATEINTTPANGNNTDSNSADTNDNSKQIEINIKKYVIGQTLSRNTAVIEIKNRQIVPILNAIGKNEKTKILSKILREIRATNTSVRPINNGEDYILAEITVPLGSGDVTNYISSHQNPAVPTFRIDDEQFTNYTLVIKNETTNQGEDNRNEINSNDPLIVEIFDYQIPKIGRNIASVRIRSGAGTNAINNTVVTELANCALNTRTDAMNELFKPIRANGTSVRPIDKGKNYITAEITVPAGSGDLEKYIGSYNGKETKFQIYDKTIQCKINLKDCTGVNRVTENVERKPDDEITEIVNIEVTI